MPESKPNGSPGGSSDLADPVRLNLLNAMFRLAVDEIERRTNHGIRPAQGPAGGASTGDVAEAAQLTAALSDHIAGLEIAELEQLHTQLAQNLLREIDRRLAGPGIPPGERPDLTRLNEEPRQPAVARNGAPRVGLVSPVTESSRMSTSSTSTMRPVSVSISTANLVTCSVFSRNGSSRVTIMAPSMETICRR